MSILLGVLLSVTATFLILLVLVQRGRGGGLTGALGGMGGQSAFGAKAGDVFTRVTMVTAVIWVLLCVASIKLLGGRGDKLSGELGAGMSFPEGPAMTEPLDQPKAEQPAESEPADGGASVPDSGP